MNPNLIAEIQRFTLNARHELEQEASEQLEGLYGWLPDGAFASAELYPAVVQIQEARETRTRIEKYAEAENEAGYYAQTAREMLVRETAFTWLNRFVALRMMEERRLIKETINRLADSNAYKLWVADELDPEAAKLHRDGELPVSASGEGPRHQAYRRFILWECGRLARDVSVLFDPTGLPSRLFPRPAILKRLIKAINAPELVEAWRPGNEETIGWVYQAFNAEEKKAVFEGFGKGKKVTAEQIPPATQIFTPRWVVRFLMENSLGRLWTEMHPDSRLIGALEYFVPSHDTSRRPLKPVREITFLDPACGSMHFGLVAFDLFAEMYREEIEKAGNPGWPERPSVADPNEIPTAVIEFNLHGIDIDLRAVQLSALTLLLRARTMNPNCSFSDQNLACADVEHITAGRLSTFIRQAKFEHPIFERILLAMAEKLKDSNNLGSLLRPEEDLQNLIREERKKARVEPQMALRFPEIAQEKFQTQQGMEEFFDFLEGKILDRLDEFVRRSRESGQDPAHFAVEAAKGLRFMRLVQHRYDVVATNPPYIDSRDFNAVLKAYLEKEYPESKRNLYSAFIMRNLTLVLPYGLIAMITGQSFMFILTFEALRTRLLKSISIETLAQYGYHLFAERVDTTAFVLRQEADEDKRDNSAGTYFRLVHERDTDSKREAFESALESLREGRSYPQVFRYKQKNFDAIPGKPWVYWMPDRFRDLFKRLPRIAEVAEPRQGLATASNTRFMRTWWEVGSSRIGFNMLDGKEAKKSGKKWFPYMKGGTPTAWYGNQVFVLNWFDDGAELYAFRPTSVIRNPDFYFRRGVTWSLTSSKGFAARLSPGGFIFDVNGMTCFPSEEDIPMILGLLNSRIAQFLLSALNPTIAFQVGDIERLPVPGERNDRISELVNKCVEITKQESREIEVTFDFIGPLGSSEEAKVRKDELSIVEAEIDQEVSELYGLSEHDLGIVDRELSSASGPVNSDEESDNSSSEEENDEDTDVELDPSGWVLNWISYAAGIIMGHFKVGKPDGLGRGDFAPEVINKLKPLINFKGIMVNDPGQPYDLARRCLRVLEILLGEREAAMRINTVLGDGDALELLQTWFDRFSGSPASSFWKYHFQLYRKRPVYWPLQSPDKRYTVWVFHERITRDTLFQIRNDIVKPRLRLAERTIADLRVRAESDRNTRKESDRLRELNEDLGEFSKRLKAVAEKGYAPHIDDGILLDAAPLYELLPSWPETKKAWNELEKGEYDWAQQAMEFWPERVREKCTGNWSFAIAHGLEELCQVPEREKDRERGKRRGRKSRHLDSQ
jgi:hypothetical protein